MAESSGTGTPPPVGSVTVNSIARRVGLTPDRSLLHVLREELGLTGAKYGCGEGECGACTVLLDGVPVRACVTPIADAVGHHVTTIEGLTPAEGLHRVQQAFVDAGAAQCGFCIPGMILSTVGLLERSPHPTDPEILAAMDGNLCRCCGYVRILDAIHRAADAGGVLPRSGP